MIFAEWVPQFDCAFAECESFAWKQFGSSNFIKTDCCQALPPRRFQIVRMVGDARRRKTASIRSRSSAGDLANQFSRALRSAEHHFRVNAALEPITCVTGQIQFARSAPNARRQKVSGFQQNVFRRIRYPSFFAAHYAADSDRAF